MQNHVTTGIDAEGESPDIAMDFDGFSECWFDDRAAFELAMASEEWLALNADAETLFDIPYSVPAMSAVLAEHVIVDDAALAVPA